jgi:prepilin-type N-terminal cleavage/methylation domain-containing protein
MRQRQLKEETGFTLIEVIAVLVIMGVMASVTVHRLGNFAFQAEQTALQTAIRELNVRESMVWSNFKLISNVWNGDPTIWAQLDTDLGGGYHWNPGPSDTGGTLHFRSQSIHLTRIGATRSGAGRWH